MNQNNQLLSEYQINRHIADRLLDRFFNADLRISFKECYQKITGDKRCTGLIQDCDPVVMREALGTTDWPSVLGNAIRRRMLTDYRQDDRWGAWRKLVKIGSHIPDFRSHSRSRIGGYADLTVVGEGAPYPALVSPPEEAASFAVTKRGGTESITLEMIKNDDINAIKRLPKRLAEAAHRTLAHFMLDFIRMNSIIYDGLPLFDVLHNNLGTAPLSASQLSAARSALMHQIEPGSGDQLGTKPKYLAVPYELEETAVNLFRRGDNNDKTFIQALNLEVVPIWYWTDTTDWCVSADPDELPSIEVGFLNGDQEPDVYIQEDPHSGSMFAHDKLTFKIRHIYGGAVIDYRGLYKSVVA